MRPGRQIRFGAAEGNRSVRAGPGIPVRLAELRKDQAALARGQAQATATKARLSPQIASAQTGLTQAKQQEQADYVNGEGPIRAKMTG